MHIPGSQIVGMTSKALENIIALPLPGFPLLFLCTRFLNLAEPTISQPGTGQGKLKENSFSESVATEA